MSEPTPEDPMAVARDARRYLQASDAGALATLSVRDEIAGFPFGSVVPYGLDAAGAPLVLLSGLAQHTHNLDASPRASLMVAASRAAGDPQASWRVTLIGEFHRVPDEGDVHDQVRARYLAANPSAKVYEAAHDFSYWRMEPRAIRFIQGFGRIHWVAVDAYRECVEPAAMAEAAPGAIAHMNEDHGEALLDYCRAFRGFDPAAAELLALDAGGFLVRTRDPERLEFFAFDEPVRPAGMRHAFVDLVKRARAVLAEEGS